MRNSHSSCDTIQTGNRRLCAPWHGNYNPQRALLTQTSAFSRATTPSLLGPRRFQLLSYAYAEHRTTTAHGPPTDLAKTTIALIDRETRHAKRGRPQRIIASHALLDPPVIQRLSRRRKQVSKLTNRSGNAPSCPAFVASQPYPCAQRRRTFSPNTAVFSTSKMRQSRRLSRQCGLDAQNL